MIALIFSDLEERILPDEFTLGGTALGVIFAAFVPMSGGILLVIFMSAKHQWLVSVGDSLLAAAIIAARYGSCARSMRRSAIAKGWDWAM